MKIYCVSSAMALGSGESGEKTSSVDIDRGRSASSNEHEHPPLFARRSSSADMSPPDHMLLAQSPSSGAQSSSPLRFIPQPLSEETLMDVSGFSSHLSELLTSCVLHA